MEDGIQKGFIGVFEICNNLFYAVLKRDLKCFNWFIYFMYIIKPEIYIPVANKYLISVVVLPVKFTKST